MQRTADVGAIARYAIENVGRNGRAKRSERRIVAIHERPGGASTQQTRFEQRLTVHIAQTRVVGVETFDAGRWRRYGLIAFVPKPANGHRYDDDYYNYHDDISATHCCCPMSSDFYDYRFYKFSARASVTFRLS